MRSGGSLMDQDKFGLVLVLISSVLLGIWATMNTIALRNVLLWAGALFAFTYWWNWFKANKANHTLPSLSGLYWLSVMLIGLMFIWVVTHYFLFAQKVPFLLTILSLLLQVYFLAKSPNQTFLKRY